MVLATELGGSTSKQIRGTSPMILVPLGATEQHGPHLPLDTDTRISAAVARAVLRCLRDEGDTTHRLLAPPIPYGASGEHQGFAGTVSIGTAALEHLLTEYVRSASDWAARVMVVNGHGGNVAALRAAVPRLRAEDRDAAWWSCGVPGGDAHAGHTETSILMYLSPEVVAIDRRRAGNPAPLAELMPAMRAGGIAAVSDNGVLGDPTTATAADGERLFAEMVKIGAERIRRWSPGPDGMLR